MPPATPPAPNPSAFNGIAIIQPAPKNGPRPIPAAAIVVLYGCAVACFMAAVPTALAVAETKFIAQKAEASSHG
ncbi:hypothetical protein L207DRAFT_589226 [Hyaloscypha variabilis F]|uniref:Uncharacterized protein n=1 Tax=Hyaloscypha variabilis (strain UAMH 11265 / GT02V1 / F) TaxID=1149755 RepID=A0A2J6R575_HYAVF|nr:hypothetical protein L207DRAFT_589226 [Hyaloscypha variabilis F]